MTPISQLPKPTQVNKVIPKNAFDSYCTAQQKRLFTEKVEKIRWTNKLAWETINLPSVQIKEIQCFEIDLRDREGIDEVLKIIDRAIPYPILFSLSFGTFMKRLISQKHPHPTNEDNAVVDWTFESPWTAEPIEIHFDLRENLDEVFRRLCLAVSGENELQMGIDQLVTFKKESQDLESKIQKIKSRIANEKQFNRRVELNLELQTLERRLKYLV
ncbi:DUF4391 domain-containing protein [Algoriphagus terrigena]|uniref:DUF4391 domain-containing protein n=1 Tax=Algoriphagus terrigena TaxID=344884 RepID=UPI0003FAB810